MKTFVAVFLAGLTLALVGSGCGEDSTSAEGTTESESTTESQPAPPRPATPKERVRGALGDEVEAGGYAGNVQIQDLAFEGREAQVTAKTPEGGFEGPSCADLDEGARAIFETVYNDGGWSGGAAVVYQGGLVDSSTGEELPGANTGIFTMPAGQARRIDWSDEDALLNIDWSIYRDFCHPALQ
jgi:hypothetical protein